MVKPSRPLSGYFRFAATVRAGIEKKHKVSGIKSAPFVSKAWNALSEAQKKPFQNAAAKEMVTYKKKMEAYKKTDAYQKEVAEKKAKKFKKFPKDKNAPKKAQTGYMLYGADVRPKLMKQLGDVTKVMKKIGSMWQELSDAEKAKYTKKAAAEKVKYEKRLATYQKSAKYQAFQEQLAEFKRKRASATGAPKTKKK